ncbi:MAG: hypothetical protein JW751_20035 [Polyangiaceae bacterium]|nr:hypothetical protein [Polyangiaceae bacterium]
MEPIRDTVGASRGFLSGPSPPSVVAWGEVLWDLFDDGARLGGAAANVAFHVAQLGGAATLVSRVGTDELGARARATLEASGVDVAQIQSDAGSPTGTVSVTVRTGEPLYTIRSEVAWDRIAWNDAVAQAIGSADVFYFGTLAQRTLLGRGALAMAWTAIRAGCLRVCDLNVRPPFEDCEVIAATVGNADVVKLNLVEASLVERAFPARGEAIGCLLDQGVKLVALTRGAGGCTLATRTARVDHPGFPIVDGRGDPVGAGDAFVAVLCCELGRARGLPTDLRPLAERANRVAAYVASCPGAMAPLPPALVGG